jgi:hypothetical protein
VLCVDRLGTVVDTCWYRSIALQGATCTGRATRHRHRVGNYQAVIRGQGICVFRSDRTGNKTSKYDGEDGRMDEVLHDLVTFVCDCFVLF